MIKSVKYIYIFETGGLYDEKSNVAYDDNNVENSERLTGNNLEREIDSAMNFEGYADYLKGLADLKCYLSSKLSSLCSAQSNVLIGQLRDENEFLRGEIREMRNLVKDLIEGITRQNHSSETIYNPNYVNTQDFVKPKKVFKSKVHTFEKRNDDVTTHNRYDILYNETVNEDNYISDENNDHTSNKYKQRTSHSNVQKKLIKDNSNVKKSQNASENKNKNLYKHSNRLRMNKDDHTVFFDDTNKVHNTPNEQTNDNTENGSKVVAILGDSIVKYIKGYQMAKSFTNKTRVIVKSFAGATNSCMRDYIRPTLKKEPNIIVLHTGTNDLKNENKDPDEIAKEIIDLVYECKQENNTVMVSSITPRQDHLRNKAQDVNEALRKECNDRNISYIGHNNINGHKHLNGSKIHLNQDGSGILAKNLINALKFLEN